jgi:uncharacterized RDD family membrane protein YckC
MATSGELHNVTSGASGEAVYSGFWRRFAALIIDSLILLIPAMLASAFTFGIGAIILYVIYGAYFESSASRATFGKQACGIRVETVDGAQLSFGAALGRQLLKTAANFLSIIGWLIFFVPAAFTERKQGLHDLAVSSVVLRDPGKGIPSWLVGVIAALIPIVVAGVLAAIAIPAYHDYVKRAKAANKRSELILPMPASVAHIASTEIVVRNRSTLQS